MGKDMGIVRVDMIFKGHCKQDRNGNEHTMEKLEYTVRQTICRYHMLQPGDQVVIALSGGADSVCLLSLLADMREEWG